MDGKSLYTNIPNQEGIDAVKSYLQNADTNSLIPVISSFLWLILTSINFTINDKNNVDKVRTELCKPIYGPLRGNIPLSTFDGQIDPVSTLH